MRGNSHAVANRLRFGMNNASFLVSLKTRRTIMNKSTVQPKLSDKDRLLARPDAEKLRTPLEPNSPEARHEKFDPKLVPATGQGDPDATDPAPTDAERSA